MKATMARIHKQIFFSICTFSYIGIQGQKVIQSGQVAGQHGLERPHTLKFRLLRHQAPHFRVIPALAAMTQRGHRQQNRRRIARFFTK